MVLSKIYYNKNNNQAIVILNKKKIELLRKTKPRFLDINEEDLIV